MLRSLEPNKSHENVTNGTGTESFKRLVYFRIYQAGEKKKKLSFLFLRVVSEVIPKSTISEPIYTEKSISTGVKSITEG